MAVDSVGSRGAVILYARYFYVNPSFPLLLSHYASGAVPLVRAMDVTTAARGAVAEELDRATVAILDQSVVNAATWPAVNHNLYYHVANARPADYYAGVLELFAEASVAKALLANSDLHDARDLEFYRSHAEWFDALFWLFEKRPDPVASVPEAYRDPWLGRYRDPAEQWAEITELFATRVEAWFSVAEAEVRTAAVRPLWDACVPGATYRTRVLARNALRARGVRSVPFSPVGTALQLGTAALNRITTKQQASRAVIRVHQQCQRQLVSRSCVSFVCGSGLRYPVRKYLEIPACRSALLAYPCHGFNDYGFRDGVHCVTTLPEDAGHAARALLANDGLRTRLVAAASDLVRSLHTVSQRATQLAACLERLGRGTLRGAQFVEGKFEIY